MLDGIQVLNHSCIKIVRNKIIYFDPFSIEENYNDADIIFITHSHYDHFSFSDIEKVKKNQTIFVVPEDLLVMLLDNGIDRNLIMTVYPGNSYVVANFEFSTIPAYNVDKNFHLKANNWVGYVIEIDNVKYYIAGDTDITVENKLVNCDVAFVPVGGVYTMDYQQAATLVNMIKPKMAVPIHYGKVVGNKKCASEFIKLLDNEIEGIILMK